MSGREAAASEGPEAPDEREAGEGLCPTSLPWAFLHLAVLTAFALGQPLFDLLGKNPEFFAARGSTAGDIITFSVLVVVGPPLIGVLIEFLVGLASKPARQAVHLVFITLLTALGVIQFLKDSFSGTLVLLALSLALGALLAFGYSRAEPVRSFLSVLSPAPLVLLFVFLFVSPVSDIVTAGDAEAKDVKGGSNAPIVFLGLDEFPAISITDSKGRIDAKRYPGIAELASKSTWFSNAHSIYDSTSRAWPAILDGNYPVKEKRLPTSADHPDSLFAILGKSHQMNVSEEATTVCPRDLCRDDRLDEPFADRIRSITDDLGLVYQHMVAPPAIERKLDSVSETWGDFGGGGGGGGAQPGAGGSAETGAARGDGGKNTIENLRGGRTERLDEWIESIKDTRRPTLNFKHLLLPHVPWQYLPDGRAYSNGTDPIPQISRQSYPDQGQIDVLQQRHLLQVGFVDRELRRLIAQLKKEGLWDKAMVVLTADHGVAFRKGTFDRRKATEENVDEISPVPLFIKAPGQQKGRVNREIVETTDILPTMLDILNIDPPEKTDGKSAFSAAVRNRTEFKMLKRDLSGWIRMPDSEFERRTMQKVRERIAKFGNGSDGPARIYRIGPSQQLIGQRAQPAGRSQAKVTLVRPGAYADVDPGGPAIPTWVTGRVSGGTGRPQDIAVAVNGTVRATGNTFKLASGGGQLIGVLVPPSAFRKGRNRVEVFEVQGGRLLRWAGARSVTCVTGRKGGEPTASTGRPGTARSSRTGPRCPRSGTAAWSRSAPRPGLRPGTAAPPPRRWRSGTRSAGPLSATHLDRLLADQPRVDALLVDDAVQRHGALVVGVGRLALAARAGGLVAAPACGQGEGGGTGGGRREASSDHRGQGRRNT